MSQSRLGTASALLNCLEQLHGDVWAEVLLPKLRADKSAGNLALTCFCLRDMCQRSQRKLDLSCVSNSGSSSAVDTAALGALAQHFPNCTLVKIELDKEGSYLSVPAIVDALARLSSLTGLSLSVRDKYQPLALAMALSTLTRQLPQLSSLSLNTTYNWAQVVWDELGTAKRLTSFSVDCAGSSDADQSNVQNFAALRGLTGLQQLVILHKPHSQQEQEHEQEQDDGQPGLEVLLGALTALTRLEMPVMTAQGLSSISSCTALKWLLLNSAGPQLQLAGSNLAALGQLTQLTLLHIGKKLQDPNPEQQSAFYSALGKLTCLRGVSAGFWTPAVLPVLAALPKLAYLKGAWQDGGDASAAVCTPVTCMCGLSGPVPFAAFPNLEVASRCGAIDAASWLSLGGSCPKLRAVYSDQEDNKEKPPAWTSLPPDADSAARVAAIQGLSALTGLTTLTFHLSDKFEMAALVEAVPQVQHLHIADCGSPRCWWSSWSLLGRFSHLKELSLRAWDVRAQDLDYFAMLLAGVSHVPKVWMFLPQVNHRKCLAAAEQSRAAGIKLPPGLWIRLLSS